MSPGDRMGLSMPLALKSLPQITPRRCVRTEIIDAHGVRLRNTFHHCTNLQTNSKDEKSEASQTTPHLAGSSKLFADAAIEERKVPAKPTRLSVLESKHQNWTGDERVEDTVLRMLVDKYKPLRSGTIRSADEKLRDKASSPSPLSSPHLQLQQTGSGPKEWANKPLIPAIEGHRPWHTIYTAPTTATVRLGNIPPPPTTRASTHPTDERERWKTATQQRKIQHADRLTKAKEGTLDYRLGVKKGGDTTEAMKAERKPPPKVNPVSMRGWNSLVEDKIEKARLAGAFNKIKGRGQPLIRTVEESNPFIGREEFLINRIVQRNGAVPPWVEIQDELETALNAFREVVKQSWMRRTLRNLTSPDYSTSVSAKLSVDDIASMRDTEWEEKELAYHNCAIEEINKLVRKYNGMAPYSVRRGYYDRKRELARAYLDSSEDIHQALKERQNVTTPRSSFQPMQDSDDAYRVSESGNVEPLTLRDMIRAWAGRLFGHRTSGK